jgi:hypothetical protein
VSTNEVIKRRITRTFSKRLYLNTCFRSMYTWRIQVSKDSETSCNVCQLCTLSLTQTVPGRLNYAVLTPKLGSCMLTNKKNDDISGLTSFFASSCITPCSFGHLSGPFLQEYSVARSMPASNDPQDEEQQCCQTYRFISP